MNKMKEKAKAFCRKDIKTFEKRGKVMFLKADDLYQIMADFALSEPVSNEELEFELGKIFVDLENNAYDYTYHHYYFKEANQIIRKHFTNWLRTRESGNQISDEKIITLKKKNKQASEFIKDIAELLGMDVDGIGYDGCQWSIDDFEDAILGKEWVSVGDRLPLSMVNVLIITNYGGMDVCFYNSDNGLWTNSMRHQHTNGGVTYWMELLNPPYFGSHSDQVIDLMNKDKYRNLSADDKCPDCKELRDENGKCNCEFQQPVETLNDNKIGNSLANVSHNKNHIKRISVQFKEKIQQALNKKED